MIMRIITEIMLAVVVVSLRLKFQQNAGVEIEDKELREVSGEIIYPWSHNFVSLETCWFASCALIHSFTCAKVRHCISCATDSAPGTEKHRHDLAESMPRD